MVQLNSAKLEISCEGKKSVDDTGISNFQQKRQQFFNLCFNNNEIISLLEKWKSNIKSIALKSISKRKRNLWKTNWISRMEININNYLCSGNWFAKFQKIISQDNSTTQRLVTYFLISKVIEKIFKGNFYENKNTHENTNSLLISKNIITLNPAESQKFSYISDWILFKLLKRDHIMNFHLKFFIIHNLLETLCTEKVEHIEETKSQITNIISKPEFIQYMIYLESLTLELFENHNELGSNILQYVKNNLLSNSFLLEKFITTITKNNIELDNEELKFVYERCISIYMKSCQKTWRNVNNYISEKGTASLRENLKTIRSNKLIVENKENKKSTLMKKINLPSDPMHALEQLRVWAQLYMFPKLILDF
ncbi:hypothetical protein Glove_48g137 [Diversispora epigaea]|uniref:Uncharacterized protein n=1 Tax=Diversispora epigaea TaxID=1348612 RepID=A0A397JN46_9GLOM|nr:hypothetical protein Glove_48g137 [Diversispora epigaea]